MCEVSKVSETIKACEVSETTEVSKVSDEVTDN